MSETSVIELICHELDKDGLTFHTPLFETIYRLFREGLSENTLLKTSYFKHLEDQDIVRYVTDIESSEHELSAHWINKYNIHTRSESDKLNDAVMNAIYSFKSAKIEQRINEIRTLLSAEEAPNDEEMNDLVAEQILLEKIKLVFSERLGRIILR
jgi:DNA primase